jgi:hypothetical protein
MADEANGSGTPPRRPSLRPFSGVRESDGRSALRPFPTQRPTVAPFALPLGARRRPTGLEAASPTPVAAAAPDDGVALEAAAPEAGGSAQEHAATPVLMETADAPITGTGTVSGDPATSAPSMPVAAREDGADGLTPWYGAEAAAQGVFWSQEHSAPVVPDQRVEDVETAALADSSPDAGTLDLWTPPSEEADASWVSADDGEPDAEWEDVPAVSLAEHVVAGVSEEPGAEDAVLDPAPGAPEPAAWDLAESAEAAGGHVAPWEAAPSEHDADERFERTGEGATDGSVVGADAWPESDAPGDDVDAPLHEDVGLAALYAPDGFPSVAGEGEAAWDWGTEPAAEADEAGPRHLHLVAGLLEDVARRVRSGEIDVPTGGATSPAAALASVLAALLSPSP